MAIHKQNLPAGFPQETREGLTAKRSYSSPTITSVEFAVEHCFESTQEIKPLASGSTFRVSGQNSLDGVDGSSNSWNEAENNWFYE